MALSVDVICWLREQLLPKAHFEEKRILKNACVWSGLCFTSDEAQGPGNSIPLLLVMWSSSTPETGLLHTPETLHLQQEIWAMGKVKAMRKPQVQTRCALYCCCLSSHTDHRWCCSGQSQLCPSMPTLSQIRVPRGWLGQMLTQREGVMGNVYL